MKHTQQRIELLTQLADYRVLTVRQVAVLQNSKARMARQRAADLLRAGLVQEITQGVSRGRGRLERAITLSCEGIELLREKKVLSSQSRAEEMVFADTWRLDHQVLVNMFRVHLVHGTRVGERLQTKFIAPDSLLASEGQVNMSSLRDNVHHSGQSCDATWFTPDGVFAITSAPKNKTLLFMLEVDMGTEPRNSPKTKGRDFRQKLLNYQEYFRSKRYKRYEEVFSAALNGFRLLVLSHSSTRHSSLSALVRATQPNDFVWLADQESLLQHGVFGRIWEHTRNPSQRDSILGTLAFDAPLPSE